MNNNIRDKTHRETNDFFPVKLLCLNQDLNNIFCLTWRKKWVERKPWKNLLAFGYGKRKNVYYIYIYMDWKKVCIFRYFTNHLRTTTIYLTRLLVAVHSRVNGSVGKGIYSIGEWFPHVVGGEIYIPREFNSWFNSKKIHGILFLKPYHSIHIHTINNSLPLFGAQRLASE